MVSGLSRRATIRESAWRSIRWHVTNLWRDACRLLRTSTAETHKRGHWRAREARGKNLVIDQLQAYVQGAMMVERALGPHVPTPKEGRTSGVQTCKLLHDIQWQIITGRLRKRFGLDANDA